MIVTTMLTTLLASALFTLAAYCAERAFYASGRPTRFPWVAATVLCVAVPFAELLILSLASSPTRSGAVSAQLLPLTTILADGLVHRVGGAAGLEPWILGVWLAASFAVLVRLVLASRALARLAATWRHGVVAGERTWLSENHGPAVVGLADPEIVIPRRITELPLEEQRLAVAHELEHIRARDQWLVRMAAFAAVAAPWNPFLWLATRRLRSAIEIDCDTRVLQKQPNVRAYASLVLNVAGWPRQFPAAAPALGETGVAQLERRLRLMTSDKRSPRILAGITMLAAALALGAYGCDVAVSVDRPEPKVHTLTPVVTTATTADNAYFEFQVDKPVTQAPGSPAPRYPDVLRKAGIEGEVLAQFVVDAEGRADAASFKALKTSHQLFADAVRSALPVMSFVPAEVKGNRVRQLVQQPFVFAIAK